MRSLAVRADLSKQIKEEYTKELDQMDLAALVKEFFTYLDYREESDSGREFPPIYISSCRVLMTEPMEMVLVRMREKTHATTGANV